MITLIIVVMTTNFSFSQKQNSNDSLAIVFNNAKTYTKNIHGTSCEVYDFTEGEEFSSILIIEDKDGSRKLWNPWGEIPICKKGQMNLRVLEEKDGTKKGIICEIIKNNKISYLIISKPILGL